MRDTLKMAESAQRPCSVYPCQRAKKVRTPECAERVDIESGNHYELTRQELYALILYLHSDSDLTKRLREEDHHMFYVRVLPE